MFRLFGNKDVDLRTVSEAAADRKSKLVSLLDCFMKKMKTLTLENFIPFFRVPNKSIFLEGKSRF